jgi:septal ring factor EnvC (AmiA/AmiB activator)
MALARLVAVTCLVLLSQAYGAPSPEELKELRARIEKLQRDLAAAEQTRGGAADQLRESEKAVSEAHRALFALGEQRRGLEDELETIAAREREARATLATEQALAERLLRLQYQQGATDRLRLALEGRDAADVARRIAYYGYIQKARSELIGALREKAGRLALLQREALDKRDALTANLAAQEDEARVLQRERAARAAVVQRLAGEIARGQREMGKLKRDEARLAKLVEELTRALAQKPEPKPKPRAAGRAVERVADASLASKPFASLKGRLKLPVRGGAGRAVRRPARGLRGALEGGLHPFGYR